MTDRAFNAYRAVMLLDNPAGDRHPKPSAFMLCREERLKNIRQLIGGNPLPGVGDSNQRSVGIILAKRDFQAPSLLHRLDRVEGDIPQDLLNLLTVSANHNFLRGGGGLEADVL